MTRNITQNRKIASRAIISALVLAALAFSGVAAAEQLYVNESGWWRADGAFNASGTPIQGAVNAAAVGDAIFVWNGSYSENVDVDKSVTLEGEGADVVTVTTAVTSTVFKVTADYVNISGFAVRGASDLFEAEICRCGGGGGGRGGTYPPIRMTGICLGGGVGHCNISDNVISGNDYGICLYSSSNNNLSGNTASGNDCGIHLSSSSNNNLTDNIMSGNNHNFDVDGSSFSHFIQNIDTSNLVNGKPVYYFVDQQNKQVPNDAGFVGIVNSTNITVRDITLTNNSRGVLFAYTNNSRIENVTASGNDYSIHLYSSNDNKLTSNNVSNSYHGIYLWDSDNNTLTSNTANSNNHGIYLCNADTNTIICNWVQNNTQNGIRLYGGSTDNNISYNNIIENGNYNAASGGWEWQFYINQYQPVEAKHNYWGAGMNSSTIDASIYDDEEGGWGEVEFYPFETEPVPCTPTPEEPHTFTTTDAVIALQIAVGSRPPDLRWDVSGDKRVTSLDALMILQAAAGSIEIG